MEAGDGGGGGAKTEALEVEGKDAVDEEGEGREAIRGSLRWG